MCSLSLYNQGAVVSDEAQARVPSNAESNTTVHHAGSPAPLASLLTEASWQPLLNAEAQKSYWKALQVFVDAERQSKQVFPPPEHTFRALNSVPLCEVRVVILGQVSAPPDHPVLQA